jgi:hypothetical protein
LKNITQKEIFVHSLGLFGSSKLTSKVVVIALAAGLLGAGVAVVSPAEPANAASCSSAATGYAAGSGDGTSTATAFRISTSADLIRLSTTSADWTGKFFIQTADIDLGGCEWSPIGRPSTPFTGFYNGGGKVISGLSITTATPTYLSETLEEVGMFAEIRNSRIENLTLRGNISIPDTSGLYFVGSLVGLGSSTGGFTTVVSKVRSEVSITTTNLSGTGGIVGEFGGTMEYSSFVGSMQVNVSSGSRNSGGLSGWLRALSQIENSYARVSYSGTSTLKTGINGRTAIPIRKSYSASSGVNAAFVDSGPSSGLVSINSFWDSDLAAGVNPQLATSNSLAGVTGETTASMKSISTFSSGSDAWDIVEGWEPFSSTSSPAKIWGICSDVNDGYPFLLWEYTIDPCTVAPPPSNSSSGSSGGFSAPPQTTITSSGTTLTVNLNKTRELLLSGSNLNLVIQASVGGENATINFVASDSGNLVISTLPLLPSGKYTLTLLTPTGLVPGEIEVGIIARITKLRAIEASGKLSTQVRSEVRKQNLTYDSAGTLSCWGVTTSSSGSALALAKQKAEKVCAYAKRQNPELDIVASSRTGTGKPARNQVVKLRYLK